MVADVPNADWAQSSERERQDVHDLLTGYLGASIFGSAVEVLLARP